MTIFFDGIDRTGKSTQVLKAQALLTDKPVHMLHYSSLKGFSNNEDVKEYSNNLYNDMFSILKSKYKTSHFIIDRAHISEAVYSPIYRKYDGSYVYDIEKRFSLDKDFWNQVYFILLIDEPENVIKRDDGLSFTVELEKKKQEIEAFIYATNKSLIIHKLILNIKDKDIQTVHTEIGAFLGK